MMKLENGLVVLRSLLEQVFTQTTFTFNRHLLKASKWERVFKEELLRVQALCKHMGISVTHYELQERQQSPDTGQFRGNKVQTLTNNGATKSRH